MGAVDDPAVVLWVDVGLRAELEAEILDDICNDISVSAAVKERIEHLQEGGRASCSATLLRLTITVLMPLPFPSILDWRRSIL